MRPRSHICIMNILIVGMIAGCTEPHDSHSTEHHPNEPDAAQHAEHKHDTDNIKPLQGSVPNSSPAARSADAHSHGDAELAIVIEENVVTIELDSPIYNILGFEHAPETDAQKAALKQAEQKLGSSEALFTFNNKALCKALSRDVNVALFDTETHEEDHDDEDHDDEEDHDDTEAHNEDNHKDVILTYDFECQNPANLSNVNINLFEFFENLSEIDVTLLGPATQKQVILNPNQKQLDITPLYFLNRQYRALP
ncbi:MAG: DUF2796 domain-containing protein [Litorimonas sp.]